MTVLATAQEIVTAACQELGLGAVNLVNTSTDQTGYQILGTLNALGEEILRIHDWQSLERVMEFIGDGVTETFDIPADFGRQVNQTQWDASARRPLQGPDSPQIWSWNKYGIISVGVFYRYRILHNKYTMFPVPPAGERFDLYYISKNWVADADDPDLLKDKITKPGDIVLFDRRMMTAGLKAKFWAQKGFDTTVLQEEFNYMVENEKSMNQGARVINLCYGNTQFLIGWANIPDGTYYGS